MPLLLAGKAVLGYLTKNWKMTAVALAVAGLAYTGVRVKHELDAAYLARNVALLSLDSLEAVNDTTRLQQVQAYGRLLDVYQRRAVQSEHVADSVSEALEIEAKARVAAEARLDTLNTEVTGTLVEADSVEAAVASFDFYQEPFQVWAQVTMENPPIMNFRLQVDPIKLGVYVGCRPADDGVAPAYVNVTAPDWARIVLQDPVFHPDVCNPGLSTPPSLWSRIGPPAKKVGVVTVMVGGAVLLHRLFSGHWIISF